MVFVLTGLTLFGLAAAQLGAYMQPVQTIPLTANGNVPINVVMQGKRGIAMTMLPRKQEDDAVSYRLHEFNLNQAPLSSPSAIFHSELNVSPAIAWSAAHPHVTYILNGHTLQVMSREAPAMRYIDLASLADADGEEIIVFVDMKIIDRRLYIQAHFGLSRTHRVLRFDLSDPIAPRFEQAWDITTSTHSGHSNTHTFTVPAMEGLTSSERFEVVYGSSRIMNPQTLVLGEEGGRAWRVYTAARRTETSVTYELRGTYDASPLERLMTFGDDPIVGALLRDDRLYTLSWRTDVVAYDISDPSRPRKVGHFRRPDNFVRRLVPLEGGRVGVVGEALYVLE